MVGIHRYTNTYSRKKGKSIRIQKLRKSTYNFFLGGGFLEMPSWRILLESSMPSFIEVIRLETSQKSGELWLEGEERKKQGILNPFRLKFKIP